MNRKIVFSIFVALLGFVLLGNSTPVFAEEEKKAETVVCPVSHRVVEKSQAAGPFNYEGKDYYFCGAACEAHFKADPKKFAHNAKDHVCGMKVDPAKADKLVHGGKEYYFCNEKCKVAFEKSPDKFVKKAQASGKYKADEKASKKGCGSSCGKGCCTDESK